MQARTLLVLDVAVAYPCVPDILIGLPFLIDTAGNALNLYDTIGWWDDANHFATGQL